MSDHDLSAVLVAIVYGDREAVDEDQKRQIAIATVVAVEIHVFLMTVKLDGGIVDVNVDVLSIAGVTEVHVE